MGSCFSVIEPGGGALRSVPSGPRQPYKCADPEPVPPTKAAEPQQDAAQAQFGAPMSHGSAVGSMQLRPGHAPMRAYTQEQHTVAFRPVTDGLHGVLFSEPGVEAGSAEARTADAAARGVLSAAVARITDIKELQGHTAPRGVGADEDSIQIIGLPYCVVADIDQGAAAADDLLSQFGCARGSAASSTRTSAHGYLTTRSSGCGLATHRCLATGSSNSSTFNTPSASIHSTLLTSGPNPNATVTAAPAIAAVAQLLGPTQRARAYGRAPPTTPRVIAAAVAGTARRLSTTGSGPLSQFAASRLSQSSSARLPLVGQTPGYIMRTCASLMHTANEFDESPPEFGPFGQRVPANASAEVAAAGAQGMGGTGTGGLYRSCTEQIVKFEEAAALGEGAPPSQRTAAGPASLPLPAHAYWYTSV